VTSQLEAVRERLAGRRRSRPGPAHVVAVMAGRGGVGVSLVAALLAIRSSQAGLRTLLVDADPWLDVQRVWLGQPRGLSLRHLQGSDLGVEALVTQVHGGLELLSFGANEAPREWRALVRRVPSIFSDRDVVVVDAGSRLEGLECCFDLHVGSVLMVSSCDAIGLASTHALMKAMHARSDMRPAVLFNRVAETEAAAAAAVLDRGAVQYLGVAPQVVGHLETDPGLTDGLMGGAMLPEHLVASQLPALMTPLMQRLRPWLVA
jgi:MinD-like ATPase involved in chromosome partitioning or flagellar assembly